MPERRLITFTVDSYRFAVPIEAIREVLSAPGVVPVPGRRRPLEGILPYRGGMVLPVFSLLDLMGKTFDETSNLVVVTGSGEDPVGFRIGSMGGVVVHGESDEVVPYEGDLTVDQECVPGVLKKPGGELILLEIDRLISLNL